MCLLPDSNLYRLEELALDGPSSAFVFPGVL
jgi:hypothetical protein